MVTKVVEGRKYRVVLVVQDVTDTPSAPPQQVASSSTVFVTDHIDNYSMNYEAAPFWARQRLQHCLPVLLDQVAPNFLNAATKDSE